MVKSDRICHVDTGDKPFYKFQYGGLFYYFIGVSMGLVSGTGFFIAFLILRFCGLNLSLVFFCLFESAGSFSCGFFVSKMMFYVHAPRALKNGFFSFLFSTFTFLGALFILFSFKNDPFCYAFFLNGIFLTSCAIIVEIELFKRHGKIGLFTDGVKIGSLTIMYDDIEAIGFGSGSLERKIKELKTNKPVEILTPIEYEYVEKDFGIFHLYLIITTRDRVYVAQSINRQSNLVQDTRNAWMRYVESCRSNITMD
ncbi:MAG: hypothetical protein ACTSVI_01275 [Promethearchaeota archaeon]